MVETLLDKCLIHKASRYFMLHISNGYDEYGAISITEEQFGDEIANKVWEEVLNNT